jgi:predicted nucleotidyltransferase
MAQRKPPKTVLEYINHLKKSYPDLRKVYMFGSFAKGSAGRDSDIDLAMVFDDVADSFDRQVQLMKIRRQYDARIEPHVFRVADFDKSNPLAEEIILRGVEVSG